MNGLWLRCKRAYNGIADIHHPVEKILQCCQTAGLPGVIAIVFPAEFGVGFAALFAGHTNWQWSGPDDVSPVNKNFVKRWRDVVPRAVNHVLSQS